MPHLNIAEAVPLGYAMVARVAADAGVRALAIKGPVWRELGIRADRRSADIDVLVHPQELMSLLEALAKQGWVERFTKSSPQIMPMYSVVVSNPAWPVEIDVHHYFPGILEDPVGAFEYLWQNRTRVRLAHRSLFAPEPRCSAVIQALHLLRDPKSRANELVLLRDQVKDLFASTQGAQAQELVDRLGVRMSAGPFLSSVDVNVLQSVDGDHSAGGMDTGSWLLRTQSEGLKGVPAVYQFLSSPWRERPRIAWKALVLTEAEIRERQPSAKQGRWGLFVARLRRLQWGLRYLPAAWALVRDATKNNVVR